MKYMKNGLKSLTGALLLSAAIGLGGCAHTPKQEGLASPLERAFLLNAPQTPYQKRLVRKEISEFNRQDLSQESQERLRIYMENRKFDTSFDRTAMRAYGISPDAPTEKELGYLWYQFDRLYSQTGH